MGVTATVPPGGVSGPHCTAPPAGHHLLPAVQGGAHGAGEAEQDLQDFGQVVVDEVAQLMDHYVDDVQEAVLAAQRQHGRQVHVGHRLLHGNQTRAWGGWRRDVQVNPFCSGFWNSLMFSY